MGLSYDMFDRAYGEREARHVGLGVQLVPEVIGKMSIPERVSLALFQLEREERMKQRAERASAHVAGSAA
jgi:hypothetical protein